MTAFFFDRNPVDPYYGALMFQPPPNKPLPRQGDPRKFAQQGIHLAGLVAIAELPRLADAVESTEGQIAVELQFGIGEDGKKLVKGVARANLELVCQRCLNPMTYPVTSEISLAILWDEEDLKALPKDLDPWIVGEGLADFYEMIEEELLLSLPPAAYHEELCIDQKLLSRGEPLVEEPKKNPFQVLEQLKSSPK